MKWSGIYVIAALGVYLVVDDALDSPQGGHRDVADGCRLRQGIATFLVFVPVAVVVYLASWAGWLLTDGGYDRHSADASPATGIWSWVPLPLQSLWIYHQAIYNSNISLSSPAQLRQPGMAVAAHAPADLDVLPRLGDG